MSTRWNPSYTVRRDQRIAANRQRAANYQATTAREKAKSLEAEVARLRAEADEAHADFTAMADQRDALASDLAAALALLASVEERAERQARERWMVAAGVTPAAGLGGVRGGTQ